jgi:hypothetical protein
LRNVRELDNDLDALSWKNDWDKEQKEAVKTFLRELGSPRLVEAFKRLPFMVGNPHDIRDIGWTILTQYASGEVTIL